MLKSMGVAASAKIKLAGPVFHEENSDLARRETLMLIVALYARSVNLHSQKVLISLMFRNGAN